MNWKDSTPEQLAQLGCNVGNRLIDEGIRIFLREAPSKDIVRFSDKLSITQENRLWIEPARFALQLKRAEETAEKFAAQMDMLNQQTEKITKQNETQIKTSLTLSNQTDILITESKKLSKFTKFLMWFTIALVICGVIQIGLMIFYYWLEKQL